MSEILKVRTLAGNNEISDDIVAFYLESAKNFILSYCNIQVVPKPLETLTIEIAALKLHSNVQGSIASVGEGIKSAVSVSDGNQSVVFQRGEVPHYTDAKLAEIYAPILDRYKRMSVDRPKERPLGARRIYYEE